MTNRYEVYRCDVCGNIVEMLHGGAGLTMLDRELGKREFKDSPVF